MKTIQISNESILPNSKLIEFQKNRYHLQSQAPFIVHIESQDSKKNIGHIGPIKLGEILIKAQVNFDNVRKIGPKKIELTFNTLNEANDVVENQEFTSHDWVSYIPNFKVLKIGQIHGIDSTYSVEKLRLAIEDAHKNAKIERIYKMENDMLTPTSSIKIYLRTTTLPETVKFFGIAIKVYPYIFNVLQCKNCFRFGHAAINCDRKPTCPECSIDHDILPNQSCNLSKRCVNCKGQHSATDRVCLKYIEQKEIKYAMATKNISLNHAKNLFKGTKHF